MAELTHISLFSGIGGIDLATEWAGFRTILFVEIDTYCQKVLRKHWPDVPIIGDIRDATKEKIMAYAQSWHPREQEARHRGQDIGRGSQKGSARRDTPISPVTLITGGFPCQPVSAAGKRRGKEDDRWLWPDMFRVISEVRPTWVVAENVTGLLTMGFYDCLSDLEGEGYEVIPFVIPACGVNASHRRDRIFIVAYSSSSRIGQELGGVASNILSKDKGSQEFEGSSRYVPKPQEQRLERTEPEGATQTGGCPAEYFGSNWWATEPQLGRVAYGIPNRVDRLKCLGNAVVPQQIYPILKAIADIERQKYSLENRRNIARR